MSNYRLTDQIAAAMQRAGVTGTGADWVSSAANPVGNTVNPGIPDGTGCRTACPRFLTEFTVGPNPAGSPGSTEYDACVIIPGGSNTASIVAVGAPGTDFNAEFVPGAVYNYCYGIAPPREFITAPLVEGGISSSAESRAPPRNYTSFRWASRFVTAEPVMSSLNDGGVITACTFYGAPTPMGIADVAGKVRNHAAYYATLNESQFAEFAPRTYTAPSKVGMYLPVPMRTGAGGEFVRKTFVGSQAIGVAQLGTATAANPFICDSMFNLVRPDSGQDIAWLSNAQNGDGAIPEAVLGTSDIGYDGTGLTVVILRSMTGPMRFRVGGTMEAVPSSTSDEVPYMTSAPELDTRALEAYELIRREMQYAYPAKYNFMGTLATVIPTIISGLIAAGRIAAPHLKSLAMHAATTALRRLEGGTPPEHAKPLAIPVGDARVPKRRKRKILVPPPGKPLPGR